jgi:hypothetical protein
VVTVALDIRPADAQYWIDKAAPTHPSLIDITHQTGHLFGFTNIPMAVWINEDGIIVRNAESASIERSSLRDVEISDSLPEPTRVLLSEVKAIPDHSEAYRKAILDWAHHGSDSPYALNPDEVIARSRPRDPAIAEATACFEMGQHLASLHQASRRTDNASSSLMDSAISWWRKAHDLDRLNWTYKRQAWTIATTPEGAEENDLLQDASAVYGTSWIRDVVAGGGGAKYVVAPDLNPVV